LRHLLHSISNGSFAANKPRLRPLAGSTFARCGTTQIREPAGFQPETVPPVFELPERVVATLNRWHQRCIEALVIRESSLKALTGSSPVRGFVRMDSTADAAPFPRPEPAVFRARIP